MAACKLAKLQGFFMESHLIATRGQSVFFVQILPVSNAHKNSQVFTAQSQYPNVINIISLTRWNANRCYSLRTIYLIFEAFQILFPVASLIFTAAKLFRQAI